ncbi:M1 family metallopeptidase [Fulvivirgaceae bacterium LMO-SS25]
MTLFLMGSFFLSMSQDNGWKAKFEQLGTTLPTPNEYRDASGAPGPKYWQQQADYEIKVTLDDNNQTITGWENVTYHNNSPQTLTYLWLQLEQNMRASDSDAKSVTAAGLGGAIPAKSFDQIIGGSPDFDGGYKINSVKDLQGNSLKYTINKTMMRVDLPEPMKTGDQFSFEVEWSYNINDRMKDGGRSGFEYFPEDGNYVYTIAQFFPRMAVYDDVNGWQNKQFLGSGEFALPFGDYKVSITVPSDHMLAATGELQNPSDVLTALEREKFELAKKTFDKPVIIRSQEEAIQYEKSKSTKTSTWEFEAENVRDFAFATSRKFIWDAMAVQLDNSAPLAMSYYPKEGNPLWEKESTMAVKNTLLTYSERTFDYPYPVAISVHAASIGMEYPMICFNFGRPRPDGSYDDRVTTRMISVIVHEIGHNYFPMIVNSDERQWAWMDEGLNSFLEQQTMAEWYPELPYFSNTPASIVPYMKGDKTYQRPIMTNPEQSLQLGPEAYTKPAAALNILRETVMGEELFDMAFKEYSQRWMFKHPQPADFFRTMEDASAIDLDWFWKGWFYTVDNVNISVDNVRWFRLKGEEKSFEGQVQAQGQIAAGGEGSTEKGIEGPFSIELMDTNPMSYGEFKARVDDEAIRQTYAGKNFYEVSFSNQGGLVMPLIVHLTFEDGTVQEEYIPAEIWRRNETEVRKVFITDKQVVKVSFDPDAKLADTDAANNVFPRQPAASRFDRFDEE